MLSMVVKKFSLFSNISSLFIDIFNVALVDPAENVAMYGPGM